MKFKIDLSCLQVPSLSFLFMDEMVQMTVLSYKWFMAHDLRSRGLIFIFTSWTLFTHFLPIFLLSSTYICILAVTLKFFSELGHNYFSLEMVEFSFHGNQLQLMSCRWCYECYSAFCSGGLVLLASGVELVPLNGYAYLH